MSPGFGVFLGKTSYKAHLRERPQAGRNQGYELAALAQVPGDITQVHMKPQELGLISQVRMKPQKLVLERDVCMFTYTPHTMSPTLWEEA